MPKPHKVMPVEVDPTKPPYKQPKRPKVVPELREFSPEELKTILEDHKKWLDSAGKNGKRANLQEANLLGANLARGRFTLANFTGASLDGANLNSANLAMADLRDASFRGANFRDAQLTRSNMRRADLTNTLLRNANLIEADLSETTGLQAQQLGGANVSRAKLPMDLARFEGLAQCEEISKKAGKLFIFLLCGCVYSWMVIATTTDVALLSNSSSSPLPILQSKIPIVGLYWAAPLILFSLYFWFHLYLQNLWKGLSELPAIFPDGKPLDEKAYPWLLNGLVQAHVPLLRIHRQPLFLFQAGVAVILAWWSVPFTFVLFWLRYLPRHDWVGTSLHVGVLAVSITAALLLYRLAAKTLRGEWIPSLSWKEKVKSLPAYQHASLTLGILGLCFLTFWTLSTWAMEGFPPHAPINSWEDLSTSPPKTIPYEWHDGPILLPRLFDYLGYRTYANLEEADISTKPPTWTGLEEKLQDEIPLVKGAKLKRANLQNANMVRAFLINADLRGANLQQANLSLANLQQAVLSLANLQEADLVRANLQQAALVEANLQEAALSGATLHKASMRFANLQEADLSLANLQEADLSLANLQEADLGRAYLQQANLGGAYLTDVKNLTQAQLNQACVDEHTKLPEGLKRPEPCKEEESKK